MSRWRASKLGDLLDKVIDNRGKNAPYVESGHEVIETGCISGKNKFPDYLSVKKYVDEATYKNWFRGHPEQGDILIITVGNGIGSVSIMQKSRGVITQNLIGLRFSKESEPAFYYYFLNQESIQDFLRSMNIGSAQPSLKVPHLRGIEVPVPALSEQKAIAGVLSSLDDKIDLLHRQNKTLEAMAETLFRQWFIVEAKADWEEGAIGDEFEFTMGQSPEGSSFNEEGVGVPMFQGSADFEFRFPQERIYTTKPTRFAKKLDTLISVRAPVGAQNMAQNECCIGRGVAAFRYKNNNDYYTYTYFKLRSLMKEIQQFNDEGTVFGSISKSDFDRLVTMIPSNATIALFEQMAKPINDKVIESCVQIKTLEKLREALLPKLMSGEVRVKL